VAKPPSNLTQIPLHNLGLSFSLLNKAAIISPQRFMWKPQMRKSLIFKLLGISLVTLFMASCSFLEFPGVYRLDIPQGNLVDPENVDQVQIGMEPRQVRYLLGTPLVTDTFNQNRWDYFYSVNKEGDQTVEHHLSILFDQGRVIDIKDKLKEDKQKDQ